MFNPQPKPEPKEKKTQKPLKRTPLKRSQTALKRTPLKKSVTLLKRTAIKQKPKKASGEFELFLKIYADQKGICEITHRQIEFDVWCFMHILGKKAYPKFRLKRENIMMVDKRIHDLYDNSSKDKLLDAFPQAEIIYENKDKLKQEYYEQL